MSCNCEPIARTVVTPCEFPNADENCPIGYVGTDCIHYNGDNDTYIGATKGELLSNTFRKLFTYLKSRINRFTSSSLSITHTPTENGINVNIEIGVSSDEGNRLITGSDGKLYALQDSPRTYIDTNTIDIQDGDSVSANLRFTQSPTINLSATPAGLKADISQSLLNKIQELENRIQALEQ